MKRLLAAIALLLLAAACSSVSSPDSGDDGVPPVRILVAGDTSLGRGVAGIVAADPDSVFAGVRFVIRSADLAMANLESPLTTSAQVGTNEDDLRAHPNSAKLLAAAGFDLMGVANNHAGDAGPETVLDTLAALDAVAIPAVGGGQNRDAAGRPWAADVGGLRIGVLAFDATGYGPAATEAAPGVAAWDDGVEAAIATLREQADVEIVGVHGGAEYLHHPDATMQGIGASLAAWNVDVVWGHGAHVVQPITMMDPDADGRVTVVATSLGNLLFDQAVPGSDRGGVLEVLAGAEGVVAMRIGETSIDRGRVAFERWRLPQGDAVLLEGEWWELLAEPVSVQGIDEVEAVDLTGFTRGDVVAAALGDVDGDGADDLVVSFRRPFREALLHPLLPEVRWQDAAGRSAHLGVFAPDDLAAKWVASAMVRPVAELAVCDGAVAVRYSGLDDPTVTAAGAWRWSGFGWDEAPDLDGPAAIGCGDMDEDGKLDPVLLRSSS